MDYSQIEKASAVPEAASMIETFRAIGYNIETAIADIIDNSISEWYTNQVKNSCIENHIAFYSVAEKGAYILNFIDL